MEGNGRQHGKNLFLGRQRDLIHVYSVELFEYFKIQNL